MKTSASFTFHGAWRSLTSALLAASLAAGCGGGGGGIAGVDTGGTGTAVSFSAGRIAGFGSIIVNGVRFDDSTARIVDDDGTAHPRSDLKLGMQTAVQAGPVTTDAATGVASSQATTIKFASQIRGPVQTLDVVAGTLTVLGQTVKVDAATVFDGAVGLGGLGVANLVEVYAFFDAATASYTATRIELKANLADFKLVGPVAALNTAAKTFTIGGATISYAGVPATALPPLSNGLVVRVHVQTVRQGTVWVATSLAADAPAVADGAETEVEGFVTDFTSAASFKVGGVAVNAAGPGVTFKSGSAAQLANGVRVEVEGVTRAGVLAAASVDVKTSGGGDQQFELHGAIESVNAAARSFVLRGETVSYDGATRFDDGTAAGLAIGVSVEVKGVLAAGGTRLAATRIKFDR